MARVACAGRASLMQSLGLKLDLATVGVEKEKGKRRNGMNGYWQRKDVGIQVMVRRTTHRLP